MPDTTQYVHYDVFDATASRKVQGPKRGPVARPTNRVDSLKVIKHLRTISAVAHICGRCVSDEARESRNDYPASVCRVIRAILHVSFKTDTQKLWIYSRCTDKIHYLPLQLQYIHNYCGIWGKFRHSTFSRRCARNSIHPCNTSYWLNRRPANKTCICRPNQ
jgi:hypothetical protein